MTARHRGFVALLVGGVLLLAPPQRTRADERTDRIDAALAKTAAYLAARQDDGGAWRSGVHGSFRDGQSLTPHVLTALYFLQADRPAIKASYAAGVRYLRGLMRTPQGDRVPPGALTFPVYTAAEASWVMVLGDRSLETGSDSGLWFDVVMSRQLNRTRGWDPRDAHFGGWGYSVELPRKPTAPDPQAPPPTANLSATIFALGALRMAGLQRDHGAFADAMTFVDRCQNYADAAAERDERFDDGGFFFAPGDAAGSKAGVAGVDRLGRRRLHSYGSMTCDGIRAMLVSGRAPDHPRVVAARSWLDRNFTVKTNPGVFARDREPLRDGAYFYYCWSLAHALQRLRVSTLATPAGEVNWRAALADELLARQRDDGAWASPISDGREDEPLVATPFAASALLICRDTAGNHGGASPPK